MLKHLYIRNYALIDELDIDLHSGFSVITGETGAGKSILLGAIGLLLGQRADSKAIKNGATKCTIEATFNLSDYGMEDFFEQEELDFDGQECIIRRELSASGKSRAFINDTPATVAQLKALGEQLIDIHSQHQNLLLGQQDFQLKVLDILAHDQALMGQYHTQYEAYRQAVKTLDQARQLAAQSRQDEDYLRFQLDQLADADIQPGEDEELNAELQTLEHAEEIKGKLYQADSVMQGDEYGAVHAVREVYQMLQSITRVFPAAEELCERAESAYIELKDIASEISSHMDNVECDPARLNYINERLNTIYTLQQKHHVDSAEELIRLQQRLQQQVDAIDGSDEHLQQLEQQVRALRQNVTELATQLNTERTRAAAMVQDQMHQMLAPLGMPNARMQVVITPLDEPHAHGMDQVEFLLAANKNGTLQPISQVASGGEIARVMLTLKAMISGAVKLPTIIFDEIDTGVSGHIAEKMALIMQQMGHDHHRQVISITHLPQIAAMGVHHYRVFKQDDEQGTTSHIVCLTPEERITEIAHMLSGSTLTDAAIDNAKALLKFN